MMEALARDPNLWTRIKSKRDPSILQHSPGLMLRGELAGLVADMPWVLPGEQQMVDFESAPGNIVMGLALRHMPPHIATARARQIENAEK
ncbi:hypothetical protein IPL68_07620 [Candidatus Saccharibacteria bacterium]|nr:MAG: hypothetical protein IPL68_07620 [Candidatus Saccharibacteria bacterium]